MAKAKQNTTLEKEDPQKELNGVTTTMGISPFDASTKSNQIILRRTLYSAGIGLIPFPAVDAALVLGVQIWMIRDLAKVYEVEFKEKIVRNCIITLVGNLGVMGGIKLIPGVGSVIGSFSTALVAGAATFAVGKVFEQHFNQGGTLLDFDPISSRAYFQKAFEEGKLVVADLKEAEKDSKKIPGIKEIWNKWIKKNPPAESDAQKEEDAATIADLQQTNEELKLAIEKLQKTMESIQNGQKK